MHIFTTITIKDIYVFLHFASVCMHVTKDKSQFLLQKNQY